MKVNSIATYACTVWPFFCFQFSFNFPQGTPDDAPYVTQRPKVCIFCHEISNSYLHEIFPKAKTVGVTQHRRFSKRIEAIKKSRERGGWQYVASRAATVRREMHCLVESRTNKLTHGKKRNGLLNHSTL